MNLSNFRFIKQTRDFIFAQITRKEWFCSEEITVYKAMHNGDVPLWYHDGERFDPFDADWLNQQLIAHWAKEQYVNDLKYPEVK